MVNLPQSEGNSRRHRTRANNSSSGAGTSSGRRPTFQLNDPSSILELEALARCAAHSMSLYSDANNHFDVAIALLRQQYNMNFKMLCPKCLSGHNYDELEAPERMQIDGELHSTAAVDYRQLARTAGRQVTLCDVHFNCKNDVRLYEP
ncbi:hypothetical protein EVAR_79000_1 [Eumeta japonica]|uniref:Uncharacterized protein n=1 Tax=Eumeta variegata TaxID=151549 RepID=A0A4C1US57_EUMVA|nr:hypothetical protein EVAR_79000_1 [Eumeta japonica]